MKDYLIRRKKIIVFCLAFLLFSAFFISQFVQGQLYNNDSVSDEFTLAATSYIDYGDEEDELGIIFAPEGSAIGPLSFNNDAEGKTYICDTVNNRIQVLSSVGEHLLNIPLHEDIYPFDIVADNKESVIVYDDIGRLYQYEINGNLINSVNVDTLRWSVRREMHLVNNKIYMQCVEQFDHLIGILENERLRAPTKEEKERQFKPGIHGGSGRRYLAGLELYEEGWVEVFESDGEIAFTIKLPVPGIVSNKILGEDEKGNIYIQVEWTEKTGVNLEVHKFSPSGEAAGVLEIPNNHYHYWTVKLLSIDGKGNIHQMLPEQERVELNIFKESDS